MPSGKLPPCISLKMEEGPGPNIDPPNGLFPKGAPRPKGERELEGNASLKNGSLWNCRLTSPKMELNNSKGSVNRPPLEPKGKKMGSAMNGSKVLDRKWFVFASGVGGGHTPCLS